MPAPLFPELFSQHHGLLVLLIAFATALGLLISARRSVTQRRHRRYQKQAARALLRLSRLRDEPARISWLRKMNPYVFEEMLLTALSRQGLRIQRNARYSGDGGADGTVWINGRRFLVQAKRYSATISAAHVSAFGLLTERERCSGLFIHTGRTGEVSRDALRHYSGITLISGQRLLWLLAGDRRWMDYLNSQSYCQAPRQPPPLKNMLLPQLFMIKREITMSGFMASKNDNLLQSAAEVDRKMDAAAKLTGSSGWQISREFS